MSRSPAPCGTETAYRRHLREQKRGGPGPCEACARAHREHVAGKRAERSAARGEARAEVLAGLVDDTPASDTRVGEPSRLDDLRDMRATLRCAVKAQLSEDPSKVHNLTKELRAVLAEIEVLASADVEAEDPFGRFFEDGGNVVGFPAPQDREAS